MRLALTLCTLLVVALLAGQTVSQEPPAVTVVSPLSYDGTPAFGEYDDVAVVVDLSALPGGIDPANVTIEVCGDTCLLVDTGVDLTRTTATWVTGAEFSYRLVNNGTRTLILMAPHDTSAWPGTWSVRISTGNSSVSSGVFLVIPAVLGAPLDPYISFDPEAWYGKTLRVELNLTMFTENLGVQPHNWSLIVFNVYGEPWFELRSWNGSLGSEGFVVSGVDGNYTVLVEDFDPGIPSGDWYEYGFLVAVSDYGEVYLPDFNVTVTAAVVGEWFTTSKSLLIHPTVELAGMDTGLYGDPEQLNPYDNVTLLFHHIPSGETLESLTLTGPGGAYTVNASSLSGSYLGNGTYMAEFAVPAISWCQGPYSVSASFKSILVDKEPGLTPLSLEAAPVVEVLGLSAPVYGNGTATWSFEPATEFAYGDYLQVLAVGLDPDAGIWAPGLELLDQAAKSGYHVAMLYRIMITEPATLTVSCHSFSSTINISVATGVQRILVNPEPVFDEALGAFLLVEKAPGQAVVTYPLVQADSGDEIGNGTLQVPLTLVVIGYAPAVSAEPLFVSMDGMVFESGAVFSLDNGFGILSLEGMDVRIMPLGNYTLWLRVDSYVEEVPLLADYYFIENRMTVDIDPSTLLRGEQLEIVFAGCPYYGWSGFLNVTLKVNGVPAETFTAPINLQPCQEGVRTLYLGEETYMPLDAIQEAIATYVETHDVGAGDTLDITAEISIAKHPVLAVSDSATARATVYVEAAAQSDQVSGYTEVPASSVVVSYPAVAVSGDKVYLAVFIHSTSVDKATPALLLEMNVTGGWFEVVLYDVESGEKLYWKTLYLSLGEFVAEVEDLDWDGAGELVVRIPVPMPETETQRTVFAVIRGALGVSGGGAVASVTVSGSGANLTATIGKTYTWSGGVGIPPLATGAISVVGEPARYFNVTVDVSEILEAIAALSGDVEDLEAKLLEKLDLLGRTWDRDLEGLVAVLDARNAEMIAVLRSAAVRVEVDASVVNALRDLILSVGEDVKQYTGDRISIVEGEVRGVRLRIVDLAEASQVLDLKTELAEQLANMSGDLSQLGAALSSRLAGLEARIASLEPQVAEAADAASSARRVAMISAGFAGAVLALALAAVLLVKLRRSS